VVVTGPFGKTFEFREPIPLKPRVPFEVRWKNGSVTLLLADDQVATTTTPRKSH